MIQYFFNQTALSEVTTIKKLLNNKKNKLKLQDFDNPFEEYSDITTAICQLAQAADSRKIDWHELLHVEGDLL